MKSWTLLFKIAIVVTLSLSSYGTWAGKNPKSKKSECPYLASIIAKPLPTSLNVGKILGTEPRPRYPHKPKPLVHRALEHCYQTKTFPAPFTSLAEYRVALMRALLSGISEYYKKNSLEKRGSTYWSFYVYKDDNSADVAFADIIGFRSIVIKEDGTILMGTLPGGGYSKKEFFDPRYLKPYISVEE